MAVGSCLNKTVQKIKGINDDLKLGLCLHTFLKMIMIFPGKMKRIKVVDF